MNHSTGCRRSGEGSPHRQKRSPGAVVFEGMNLILRAEDTSAAVHHHVPVPSFRLERQGAKIRHQPTNYPWACEYSLKIVTATCYALGLKQRKTNRQVNGSTRMLGAGFRCLQGGHTCLS